MSRSTEPATAGWQPPDAEAAFLDWVAGCARRLEPPGGGATWQRWKALADVAGTDLAAARLAEGHADAVAILAEAGRRPQSRGPYGVWASGGRGPQVTAKPVARGWVLEGPKAFCSGAGMLERALVTAAAPDGPRLFDLDVRAVEVHPGSWPAVGMAASVSATVSFPSLPVPAEDEVGPPGFYTGRTGFWWGAAGVAACWWGGARALVDGVGRGLRDAGGDEHALAAYGSGASRVCAMEQTLRWAAARIDGGTGGLDEARSTARVTREVVYDGCVAVLGLVAVAGGARAVCLDPAQSRRSADLYAYLAQHHGGRDAAALGRDLLGLAPEG